MIRRYADLAAAAALAVLSAVVVTYVRDPTSVRALFAVLLLLVLPGYSVTALIFARHAVDWERHLLLAIALSISVSIVVALILNLTPLGLDAHTWAAALSAISCCACVVAAARRWDDVLPIIRRPRFALRDVVFFLVAALVLGYAVFLGRTPLSAKNVQGYTALWLVPGHAKTTTSVRVGVISGELHPASYRLIVRFGKRVAFKHTVSKLMPGQQFTATVRLHSVPVRRTPVVALLYRQGRPHSVYRWARLWPVQRAR
jgi:uncharacterized membrane protein